MKIGFMRHAGACMAMALVMGLAMAEPAAAATIESVLQAAVDTLQGPAARLCAIIAVVLVGLAWMFGMVDLRKAAYVVVGIAIVFGAAEVVDTLTA